MHNMFVTAAPITVEVRNSAGNVRIELSDTATTTVDVTPVPGHPLGILDDIFRAVNPGRPPRPGDTDPGDPAERARVELRDNATGQTLIVDTDPAREGWRSAFDVVITAPALSSIRAQTQSADLSVSGTADRFEARTASGGVRAGDLRGSAMVQTASGDIHLADVGGDLDARSASGDVEVSAVGGNTLIQTTSGGVRLAAPAGDVKARSVSGDIRILDARSGAAELAAVSGDVEIGVHSGTLVRVDLSTVSGRTTTDFDVEDDKPSEEPPTLEISVKTTSGDIALRRAAA